MGENLAEQADAEPNLAASPDRESHRALTLEHSAGLGKARAIFPQYTNHRALVQLAAGVRSSSLLAIYEHYLFDQPTDLTKLITRLSLNLRLVVIDMPGFKGI